MTGMKVCPFCEIAAGHGAPQKFERHGTTTVSFEPLNPVTPGHRLFVPCAHVDDATVNPDATADTMRDAAEWAQTVGACNLITSVGSPATQTVFHLHIHLVPRSAGDGLALPWTGQDR